MNERLSFEVDSVKIVDENPSSSFAILDVSFFSSGLNRHNMIVPESVLDATANTIWNRPLVWRYDPLYEDAASHDPLESPCGWVKEGTEIKKRTLDDKRVMLSTTAYIWKKYSGRLLEFFKNSGNKKGVSVEISVLDSEEDKDGITILKNFCYEAITILGDIISPAIPGANAVVIQFSNDQQEYQEAYKKEFSFRYDDVDFLIPQNIKTNAQNGLNLYKEHGRGGNAVSLAIARFLIKNQNITPQKIRHIHDYFLKHKGDNLDKTNISNEYISFLLYGGMDSVEWSKNISNKLDDIDLKHLSYFERDDFKNSFENKNTDSTTSDESEKEKNMGEKEKMEAEDKKEEIKVEDKKEEMASEEEKKEPEKMEENTDNKDAEKKEEEKENKDEEDKEKMSNDANLDVAAVLEFLKNETTKWGEVADEDETEEFAKAFESKDFCKGMSALYSRMCKMSKCMEKMEEKEKSYMAEKAKAEEEQKKFEVEKTLKEMELSVDIPQEKMQEMKMESEKFALKDIESWKNHCKAIAFDFAKKDDKEKINDGIVKIGMPFTGRTDKQSNSLWG